MDSKWYAWWDTFKPMLTTDRVPSGHDLVQKLLLLNSSVKLVDQEWMLKFQNKLRKFSKSKA